MWCTRTHDALSSLVITARSTERRERIEPRVRARVATARREDRAVARARPPEGRTAGRLRARDPALRENRGGAARRPPVVWRFQAEKCALAEKVRDLDARELAIREELDAQARLMAQQAGALALGGGGAGVGLSPPPAAAAAAGDSSPLPPPAAAPY